jgi:hypothetical protein
MKAIITEEEFNAIPAESALKAEYVVHPSETGKYLAKIENVNGWALEDVQGLRNTLQEVRNDNHAMKTKLEVVKDLDIAEYSRLLAKKEEIDGWDPTNDEAFKVRLEETNANWQKKYDTDVVAAQQQAQTAEERYKSRVKSEEVLKACAKHAHPDCVEQLMELVLPKVEVYAQEGQDHVWAKGADGKPAITQIAGQSDNMSPEELVLSLKPQPGFSRMFPGSGATGGGATGGGESAGMKVDPNLSPTERLAQGFAGG